MSAKKPNGNDSPPSIIGLVRDLVAAKPGSTARDLATAAKSRGTALTKKEVNSALYTLIGLSSVSRAPGPDDSAPLWYPHGAEPSSGASSFDEPTTHHPSTTPLGLGEISEARVNSFRQLVLKGGEIVSIGLVTESANDPYVSVDVLDARIVISVNTNHPVCTSLAHNEESLNIFLASTIVDAVCQIRIRRSHFDDYSTRFFDTRDAIWREFALLSDAHLTPREVPEGIRP